MHGLRVPILGDQVPKRKSALSAWFGQTILRLTGWQIQADIPNAPKFVAIAAPHTSNWDFVFGMAFVYAIGLRVQWMGKDSLFKPPFGGLMRRMGGVPISRSSSHGVVEQMVDEFRKRTHFILAITPEGTRRKVEKWKSGFYYIALKANVPILPGFLDFSRKCVGFGAAFRPTGRIEEDLAAIQAFYADKKGKNPLQF